MLGKVAIFLCWTALAVCSRADIVHLSGRGHLRAEVTNFAEGEFQVMLEPHSVVTNISAADVRGIDFENGYVNVTLETKTPATFKGKLWLLDKQRFHLEAEDGKTLYIPFANVTTARFERVAIRKRKPTPKPAPPPIHEEVRRPAIEPDIAVITRGERVSIPQRLAQGKVTVVDFYAKWSFPCRQLEPILERIAREDADVAIRKVDIVRWGSPVAAQYNVTAIPRLQVYGADGELVRTLAGFREQDLLKAIDDAKVSLR